MVRRSLIGGVAMASNELLPQWCGKTLRIINVVFKTIKRITKSCCNTLYYSFVRFYIWPCGIWDFPRDEKQHLKHQFHNPDPINQKDLFQKYTIVLFVRLASCCLVRVAYCRLTSIFMCTDINYLTDFNMHQCSTLTRNATTPWIRQDSFQITVAKHKKAVRPVNLSLQFPMFILPNGTSRDQTWSRAERLGQYVDSWMAAIVSLIELVNCRKMSSNLDI